MQATTSIALGKHFFATPKNELVAPLDFEKTLRDHGTSFAASRLRHPRNQIY
jgi:hypothetical protein